MRRYAVLVGCLMALAACDKHDPILPGTRDAIFASGGVDVMNTPVPNLPMAGIAHTDHGCSYTQDKTNTIWDGERKVFSGFPTNNSVQTNQQPVCSGNFVYAGLTTGELVKVNAKTRQVAWIADIFRPSNLTGGASVLDIVAPIQLYGNNVYVGGLGDAFCNINAATGAKKWCANIGVANPFVLTDVAAFVVATDGNLYAVRLGDGKIYWRSPVKRMVAPTYADKIVTVGRQKFDAETGEEIK